MLTGGSGQNADLGDAWARVSNYTAPLQGFVARGGHYLGFCLGAYLAGRSPGFALLPPGADATDEVARPGAEVASEADAVVRVDWTFVSGRTQRGRWLYFQDGAVVKGVEDGRDGARVLARYSRNGDVAASVTAYGRGRVALVGPHPEATQKWCTQENPPSLPPPVSSPPVPSARALTRGPRRRRRHREPGRRHRRHRPRLHRRGARRRARSQRDRRQPRPAGADDRRRRRDEQRLRGRGRPRAREPAGPDGAPRQGSVARARMRTTETLWGVLCNGVAPTGPSNNTDETRGF